MDQNDISVTKFLSDTTVTGYKNRGQGNPIGNQRPRNWRSLRQDQEDGLYPSEYDHMRQTDDRWLHEMGDYYANDPYNQHYYYDDLYNHEHDEYNGGKKGKKGKKGKGKDKEKDKKDKDKEKEEKEKAD